MNARKEKAAIVDYPNSRTPAREEMEAHLAQTKAYIERMQGKRRAVRISIPRGVVYTTRPEAWSCPHERTERYGKDSFEPII